MSKVMTEEFANENPTPIMERLEKKQAQIETLQSENDRLRDALKTIEGASEFYSQDGVADYVMRYAHESTARLCKEALNEQ